MTAILTENKINPIGKDKEIWGAKSDKVEVLANYGTFSLVKKKGERSGFHVSNKILKFNNGDK